MGEGFSVLHNPKSVLKAIFPNSITTESNSKSGSSKPKAATALNDDDVIPIECKIDHEQMTNYKTIENNYYFLMNRKYSEVCFCFVLFWMLPSALFSSF